MADSTRVPADEGVDGSLHGDSLAGRDGEAGDTEVNGVDQNAEGNTATDEDQTPAGEEGQPERPNPANDKGGGELRASNTDSEVGRGTGAPGEESCRTENGVEGIENDKLYRRVRELALEAINAVSKRGAWYSSREVCSWLGLRILHH